MQIITEENGTVTCTECGDQFSINVDEYEANTPILVECPSCGDWVQVEIKPEESE